MPKGKEIELNLQHPICAQCDWQKRAQGALDNLVNEEPIVEAIIHCDLQTDAHARITAVATAARRTEGKQVIFPLVIGTLSCIYMRRIVQANGS